MKQADKYGETQGEFRMNRWIKLGMLAVLLAVAGIVSWSAVAFAQDPTPVPSPNQNGGPGWGMMRGWAPMMGSGGMMGRGGGMMGNGYGMHGGWNGNNFAGPDNSLVAVAAKTLGLTEAELRAELQAGKTIADVAKAKGITTDKIAEDFAQGRAEQLKTAVQNGRLTQAQADAMVATMKSHVTARLAGEFNQAGPGFGRGWMDSDGDGVCDRMEQFQE
jgi:hypothetical protein